MNEKDKEKLKEFLHFYIKSFLSDAVNEFYDIEKKNWENLKYIIDSGNILLDVLLIVQQEVQEETREILDAFLARQFVKIGN